jgi:hypothetical protein
MTQLAQTFLAIMGLLLTMLGVGGVESSISNTELLVSVAVSCLGLALMGCAVLAHRVDSLDY